MLSGGRSQDEGREPGASVPMADQHQGGAGGTRWERDKDAMRTKRGRPASLPTHLAPRSWYVQEGAGGSKGA